MQGRLSSFYSYKDFMYAANQLVRIGWVHLDGLIVLANQRLTGPALNGAGQKVSRVCLIY